MYILLNDQSSWKITRTSANDIRCGRFNILSISYLLAKLSELVIHSVGSPKCVLVGISGCSDIFVIKRIAKQKIRVENIGFQCCLSPYILATYFKSDIPGSCSKLHMTGYDIRTVQPCLLNIFVYGTKAL